mmetsp:Transcript_6594/g.13786  ORF Transcript_6594/g.13786 Transcript_6594/m.13786 type:complete len:321 (+) Transcript_6594:71-1033(+)
MIARATLSQVSLGALAIFSSSDYDAVATDNLTCYVSPWGRRARFTTETSRRNLPRTGESNLTLPHFRKRTSSLGNFIMGPDGAATAAAEDATPPNPPEIQVDDRTPYEVLKVGEKATPEEIKAQYRRFSRKYHPDTSMRRGILPGNCNSEEEIREEWYRIKDSYELLSDRKTRLRYDRKLALDDPAAAMGKAALNTLGWGIAGLGVGLFKAGEMAVKNLNDRKLEGEEGSNTRAPPGVPTIEEWTLMRDGGVRGKVYGHPDPAVDDEDIVSTSWIETGGDTGDLRLCGGGIVVQTGSGSKYFLGAPSAAMVKKRRLLKKN